MVDMEVGGGARLANASRAAFIAGVSVRTWRARLTLSDKMLFPLKYLVGEVVVESSMVGGSVGGGGGGRLVIVPNFAFFLLFP